MKNLFPVLIAGSSLLGPSPKKSSKRNIPENKRGGVAVKISPKEGKKVISDQINILPKILTGTDLILGAGIVFGVHTAADILKVPYRLVIYYPIVLGTTSDDPLKKPDNVWLWEIDDQLAC